MSGILGGSSAKTDRGNQLGGVNASWNVFNAGMPLSQQQTGSGQPNQSQGVGDITGAGDFWKSILSGNRTATAAAEAPATNAAVDQADAAKRQEASMGTARGGGTGAGNQQVESQTRATVNNDFFNARPAAAQQLEQTGVAQSGIGSAQITQALQALGLSAEEANQITNSSIQSRPTSIEANPTNGIPAAIVNSYLKALGL